MPGGEKRNQNRDSIICGQRKAGKVAALFSVMRTNISSYYPSVFGSHFGLSKKFHLATVNGTASKAFIITIQMHEMKALRSAV